jgi:hypothetical protein
MTHRAPRECAPRPDLQAAGVWSVRGWVFSGAVPDGTLRVEAETSVGTIYPASCHEGRWHANLSADDPSETVVVRAIGSNEEIIASELCVLRPPELSVGLARWAGRWFQRHMGRVHRGGVVYGPADGPGVREGIEALSETTDR